MIGCSKAVSHVRFHGINMLLYVQRAECLCMKWLGYVIVRDKLRRKSCTKYGVIYSAINFIET